MIKGRDIIVVGLQPWDIEIGSNCKDVAQQFARHNRVLYINPPTDRLTYMRKGSTAKIQKRKNIRAGKEPALVQLGKDFWTFYPPKLIESVNGLPDGKIFDFFNRRNANNFVGQILPIITQLGFKDYILFNDTSIYLGYYLKELLKPALSIYYLRDFVIKNPYWKRHGVRLEPELIAKYDMVLVNSAIYESYSRKYNKRTFMVGQGLDLSLFNESEKEVTVAEDLLPIPKPIVGYAGYLTSRRLDVDLIRYLAQKRPNLSFVFVGNEDDIFKTSDLHDIPNIYFLGHRELDQMPNYIKGFDVTINPQLYNEATAGNYPRKVDEYLALGKPVVATVTSAMAAFSEVTYLANTFETWADCIDRAFSENNEDLIAKRKEVAISHSWEGNIAVIYGCVEQVIEEVGAEAVTV
ncbi:MAG: glycosyltransferase family 1 protein [Chitinophagaceae bacterium]|nr:MAG: glycosyltransferase family 1 protein [Chitinophagaceae bacterium]